MQAFRKDFSICALNRSNLSYSCHHRFQSLAEADEFALHTYPLQDYQTFVFSVNTHLPDFYRDYRGRRILSDAVKRKMTSSGPHLNGNGN